jgi:hypothetical protein
VDVEQDELEVDMSTLFAVIAVAGALAGSLAQAATESPIMCKLNVLTSAERAAHAATTKKLAAAVVKVEDVEGGYRIHLTNALAPGELLQWVDAERRCCPFLDFEVRLARENGARWLQMTGREGVKEFLAAEFRLASAR